MKTQLTICIFVFVAITMYLPRKMNAANSSTEICRNEKDWVVIEHCLDIIRKCQLDDGLIHMKNNGDHLWAVPYFSNFAAMALLAANDVRPNQEDIKRVERWLIWYAIHQELDGTIYDQEGTVSAYKPNDKRDSTDSYAATLLMTSWHYRQAIDKCPSDQICNAAVKALGAIEAVVQSDGLTIAKPDYAIKYLMDNIEVYQGLMEGAQFFKSVGMEKESQKAQKMAARIAASIGMFWSEQDQCYAYAIDMKGKLFSGLSKPYPHGLAQLFALAYITPAKPKLWTDVTQRFQPDEKGLPVERWLIAARYNADRSELENIRKTTGETALRFTNESVYVQRPAIAVLALIDGKARFADLPLSGK